MSVIEINERKKCSNLVSIILGGEQKVSPYVEGKWEKNNKTKKGYDRNWYYRYTLNGKNCLLWMI